MKSKLLRALIQIPGIGAESTERNRAILISLVLGIAAAVTALDLYNSIRYGCQIMAYAEMLFLSFSVPIFLLFRFARLPLQQTAYIIILSMAALSIIALHVDGYGRASILVWIAVQPVLIFWLLGTRHGLIVSALVALGIFLSMLNAHMDWIAPIFSAELLFEVLLGYIAVSIIVYIFERFRGSYEARLFNDVQERETLLQELHHRVKNQMQMMIGLLWLQGEQSGSDEVKKMVNETIGRLSAMALLHEELHTKSGEWVDMAPYISHICEQYRKLITFRLKDHTQNVKMTVKEATYLGIIINEALSNVAEHAELDPETGCVEVLLEQDEEGILLQIRDNGRGVQLHRMEDTIGMALMQDLAGSIGGRMDVTENEGTVMTVRIVKEL